MVAPEYFSWIRHWSRSTAWTSPTPESTATLRRGSPLSSSISLPLSSPATAASSSDPMAPVRFSPRFQQSPVWSPRKIEKEKQSFLGNQTVKEMKYSLIDWFCLGLNVIRENNDSENIGREAHGGAKYGSRAREIGFSRYRFNVFWRSLLSWRRGLCSYCFFFRRYLLKIGLISNELVIHEYICKDSLDFIFLNRGFGIILMLSVWDSIKFYELVTR